MPSAAVVLGSGKTLTREKWEEIMATPTWIKTMLQARGVPFEELHHHEVYTAQEVAQQEHVSGHHVAKVVVVLADGRPVELILPASRKVLLDRVQQVLGARNLRLATEEEMEKVFAGSEAGAIPALRNWPGVDVLMDASMQVSGDILFQAGTHADAVRLRFEDWYRIVNPRVEQFSAPAEVAHR
jgi:Ala-tRNA(Pro) deacylase